MRLNQERIQSNIYINQETNMYISVVNITKYIVNVHTRSFNCLFLFHINLLISFSY